MQKPRNPQRQATLSATRPSSSLVPRRTSRLAYDLTSNKLRRGLAPCVFVLQTAHLSLLAGSINNPLLPGQAGIPTTGISARSSGTYSRPVVSTFRDQSLEPDQVCHRASGRTQWLLPICSPEVGGYTSLSRRQSSRLSWQVGGYFVNMGISTQGKGPKSALRLRRCLQLRSSSLGFEESAMATRSPKY